MDQLKKIERLAKIALVIAIFTFILIAISIVKDIVLPAKPATTVINNYTTEYIEYHSPELGKSVPDVSVIKDPMSYMHDDMDHIIKPKKVDLVQAREDSKKVALEKIRVNSNDDTVSCCSNRWIFQKKDLPDQYYPSLDYSSFQPYMNYAMVTDTTSPAYRITRSSLAYNDEYGFRRYHTDPNLFTVNGQDDYVIALGTFYKPKGVIGTRYLIITSTGAYTAITGDEKADCDTDQTHHMIRRHGGEGSNLCSFIEWIVDEQNLLPSMKESGSVTAGPVKAIKGRILGIYEIKEGGEQ